MTKYKLLIVTAIMMLFGATMVHASGTRTFVKSDTGTLASAVNFTPSITGKAEIQSVTVHISAQASPDIYVQLDSELGHIYDVVLATSDSVALNDFFWLPEDTFLIEKGDNIKVHIDASGTEVYTITIRGDYQ